MNVKAIVTRLWFKNVCRKVGASTIPALLCGVTFCCHSGGMLIPVVTCLGRLLGVCAEDGGEGGTGFHTWQIRESHLLLLLLLWRRIFIVKDKSFSGG